MKKNALAALFLIGSLQACGWEDSDQSSLASLQAGPTNPSGYGCRVYKNSSNDLWLETKHAGTALFGFRIGAGGVISDVRDLRGGYTRLLGSSRKGPGQADLTDSVVQNVIWSDHGGLAAPAGTSPDQKYGGASDDRFNINQAGDVDQRLTRTFAVEVDPGRCQVDVYSSPTEQWLPELQPFMSGKFLHLTRIRPDGAGGISVRQLIEVRSTKISRAEIGGRKASGFLAVFPKLLLVDWAPISPSFPNVALSLESNGKPNWWYGLDNLPKWNKLPVSSTYGYATATVGSNATSTLSLSFVFGNKQPECVGISPCRASASLNVMKAYPAEQVLMPTLTLGDIPMGTVIDKTYHLLPYKALNGDLARHLERVGKSVARTAVVDPAADKDEGRRQLIEKMRLLERERTGSRTDQLGNLWR